MHEFSIILMLILLPILGAIFVIFAKTPGNAKITSIWVSFITCVGSFVLLSEFDFSKNTIQAILEWNWLPAYGIKLKLGVDKFSILFVCMITMVCLLTILWIYKKEIKKTKHFFTSILLLESLSIGAFTSYDLILLLIFMESTIIPILIMIFSSEKAYSKEAALQYITYAMLSTLCLIIAFIMIYGHFGTTDIAHIYKRDIFNDTLCFWILMIGVAIKIPLFPLYYWLPKVHVQSSTVCSVFLASIVLKFGSLVLIRVAYPLFFNLLCDNIDIILFVAVVGLITASCNLFFEKDIKKIYAYFSVIHMSMYMFIFLGGIGIKNFVFSLLSHSFIMAFLFFAVDATKTILKTRNIDELKEISTQFIVIKNLMLLSTCLLIGLPFTSGFVVDIMLFYSAYTISHIYLYIIGGIFLITSGYMFYVYQSTFGEWSISTVNAIDQFHISNFSKKIVFTTIISVILLLGIMPKLFF